MLNLIGSRKFKGAIILGRKLLERARELTPILGQSVSRLTYRVVYCLCVLEKVDEAEKAVCELLEMPVPEKETDDVTRAYLLHTLHELALAMQRNGRTVEAEGLYLYNIRTAAASDVKTLSGTEKYDTWRDWDQLVMCLVEQGKILEARKSTEGWQSPDAEEEHLTSTIQITISAYGNLKKLYGRAMEAEKSGTGMEFRAALDVAGTRPLLKRSYKLFGSIRRRIETGRDFESDIDLHHVARARQSRLLQLLHFPLIYLSFMATKDPHLGPREPEHLWANLQQSVLGQYWKFCDCKRKRRRTKSFDEIYNRVDRPLPDPNPPLKKLKQKPITDWVTRTPVARKALEGCSPSCPCIEANEKGQLEKAEWESKLLVWEEPPEELPKPRRKARYRKTKFNKAPVPEDELFHLVRPNTWWWVQSEFATCENDDENYILSHATEIPAVTVTPPDGEMYFLPMAVEPQQKLEGYYKRDYAADFARFLEKEKDLVLYNTVLDDLLEDDEVEEEEEVVGQVDPVEEKSNSEVTNE